MDRLKGFVRRKWLEFVKSSFRARWIIHAIQGPRKADDNFDFMQHYRWVLWFKFKCIVCILLGRMEEEREHYEMENIVIANVNLEPTYDYSYGSGMSWDSLRVAKNWNDWVYFILLDGFP